MPDQDTDAPRVLLFSTANASDEAAVALVLRLERLGVLVTWTREPIDASRLLSESALDAFVVLTQSGQAAAELGALPSEAVTNVPILVATDDPTGPEMAALLEAGAASDCLPLIGSDALVRARLAACRNRVRLREREIYYREWMARERSRADALLNAVIPLGVALTVEKDLPRLLERILIEAQKFCNADSGSLYLRAPDDTLRFAIVRNQTLGLAMGGASGAEITFPPIRLYDPETGAPNSRYVVVHAAVTGVSVNIADAYAPQAIPEGYPGFDFSGTRAFDARTGYRSMSLLATPLRNGTGNVIGVLQLINALDWQTKEIVPFDANMEQIIEALGQLAAVALEGYIREQRLTEELNQLRIEIDEAKKARHVAEITESDYFQTLRSKSRQLRDRHRTE